MKLKSALFLPGLNLKPDKMEVLSKLSGFTNLNTEIFRYSSPENWERDLIDKLNSLEGPVCCVGYSLGGLLPLSVLNRVSNKIDRLILFAPAIKLTSLTNIIKRFFLLPDSTPIPSFGPTKYREKSHVKLSAYKTLFKIMSDLGTSESYDIPTLVLIDPKDKLVDFNGVSEFLNSNKLMNWKLLEISNSEGQSKDPYHHLIIDPEALGESQWKKIIEEINDFLA